MLKKIMDPPDWFRLSHHDRYRKLNIVRRRWCRRAYQQSIDQPDRTVYLDGRWIDDIPSFYLSLGEAVNGPNGYFGGCLDALSDCLNAGFGVLAPLTIRLSHFEKVREALNSRAWCRFHAEICRGDIDASLIDAGYFGDGNPSDIAYWTAKYRAAVSGEPFHCEEFGSYFDAILEVMHEGRAQLVPETEDDGKH